MGKCWNAHLFTALSLQADVPFFIPFGVTMRRPHTRTDAAVSAVGDRFLLVNSFPYATPIQTDTTRCARKICTPNGMAGSGCCRWDWKVSLLSNFKKSHTGSIHLSAKITFRAESSGAVPKFWFRNLAQKNVRHEISAWNISAWNFDMKNLPEFLAKSFGTQMKDWKSLRFFATISYWHYQIQHANIHLLTKC